MAQAQRPRVLDPSTLDVPQLQQIQKGLEGDMQYLKGAVGQLSGLGETLIMAKLAAEQLKETAEEDDLDILVPVTELLYIRGRLVRPQQFLVDIGANTMMQRSETEAIDFFARRSAIIRHSFDEICGKLSIKEIQYIRIKQEIEAKMEHMSLYNRIYQ